MSDKKTISRLELSNRKATSLQIWLEPWGEELNMPGGVNWVFVYENNIANDPVTVEFHEECISLFGIRDSVARMYEGNNLLWECFQVVSPPVE